MQPLFIAERKVFKVTMALREYQAYKAAQKARLLSNRLPNRARANHRPATGLEPSIGLRDHWRRFRNRWLRLRLRGDDGGHSDLSYKCCTKHLGTASTKDAVPSPKKPCSKYIYSPKAILQACNPCSRIAGMGWPSSDQHDLASDCHNQVPLSMWSKAHKMFLSM